jgi:putative membrane protein
MTALLSTVRGYAEPRPSRWLPIVLAVAAVACQVTYPRVGGAGRDHLTVAIVMLFAAACLAHAWLQRGWRTALAVLAAFAGGGLVVEVLGVATGFPFGAYAYSDRLGPTVGDVPLVIPLAWTMIGYPALVVARLVTARPLVGISLAAWALTAWDLFLDPQMVAEGYWTWTAAGPYLLDGIPVSNYLAWYGTAWLMMASLWRLTAGWTPEGHDDRVPVALYVWTWIGSIVAHTFFLDLPRSGLLGGIGMGAVVGLLVVATGRDARVGR